MINAWEKLYSMGPRKPRDENVIKGRRVRLPKVTKRLSKRRGVVKVNDSSCHNES